MKNYLRNAIGITQKQLAFYLDVTRTTLARAERDMRELPNKAGLKHMQLEGSVNEEPTTIADKIVHLEVEEAEEFNTWLRIKLAKCEKQLEAAEELLENQQLSYTQCRSAIQLAYTMVPKIIVDEPVAQKDKRWFLDLEYEAIQKAKFCGKTAQYQTQLNIKLLQMEIKELEGMLEKK